MASVGLGRRGDDAKPQRASNAALPARDVERAQSRPRRAMLDDAVLALALWTRRCADAPFDHRGRRHVDRMLARTAGHEGRQLLAIAHELTCGALLHAAFGALGTFATHRAHSSA